MLGQKLNLAVHVEALLLLFMQRDFGSTSHIAPSIPDLEATSHVHPGPSVSNHMRIPEPK